MGDYYDKFEYIKRKSLAELVSDLSLISNIEYSEAHQEQKIKKAQKISGRINTLEDLNKYFIFLKYEINKREEIYLKSYKVIKKLADRLPELLKL